MGENDFHVTTKKILSYFSEPMEANYRMFVEDTKLEI